MHLFIHDRLLLDLGMAILSGLGGALTFIILLSLLHELLVEL